MASWAIYELCNDPVDLVGSARPAVPMFGWRCELCHLDSGPVIADRELARVLLKNHLRQRSHKWVSQSPTTRRLL